MNSKCRIFNQIETFFYNFVRKNECETHLIVQPNLISFRLVTYLLANTHLNFAYIIIPQEGRLRQVVSKVGGFF